MVYYFSPCYITYFSKSVIEALRSLIRIFAMHNFLRTGISRLSVIKPSLCLSRQGLNCVRKFMLVRAEQFFIEVYVSLI